MKGPLAPAMALRMTLRRRLKLGDSRSHSRLVQRTKWTLPAIAVALLLLIAAWPQLQAAFEHVRLGLPHIDINEARRLRMVAPRYSGIDRQNRPFTLTAEAANQARPNSDDLVSLDGPRADMTTTSGNWIELSGAAGTYQPQPQLLDLFGNVELYQDRGNEFHTDTARIDILNGTAEGHDPIDGHGPFGNVTAEGFNMYNRGDVIVFTGKTNLNLLPRAKGAE
jgi:lipopolysaccharide export system protein LptC